MVPATVHEKVVSVFLSFPKVLPVQQELYLIRVHCYNKPSHQPLVLVASSNEASDEEQACQSILLIHKIRL